jgi:hypothetical protein
LEFLDKLFQSKDVFHRLIKIGYCYFSF